jgi:general stress protein YciG
MQTNTRNRGFASMDSQKQKEIARKGGRAAHMKGTAHEFTSEEARAAGKKGGERVSADRSHMSRIGRIGGKSSAGRRPAMAAQNGEDANRSPDRYGSQEHEDLVGQGSAGQRPAESLH